jgi:hypothetical protein
MKFIDEKIIFGIIVIGILLLFLSYFDYLFSAAYPMKNHGRWKSEKIVGDKLKEIFPHHTFNKIRPHWLRNPRTGKNLELDYYCEELNLAIEYNGKQHYFYTGFFHNHDPIKFIKQIQRDNFKENMCKKLGINLISIPYNIEYKEMNNFLVSNLVKMNYLKV